MLTPIADQNETLRRIAASHFAANPAFAMLIECHEERLTTRQIAVRYGINQSNVIRAMAKARAYLRRVGAMPKHWEAPTPQPNATDAV